MTGVFLIKKTNRRKRGREGREGRDRNQRYTGGEPERTRRKARYTGETQGESR